MLLISRKMTANIAKIGEADKQEIIEAAKYGANILINSSLQLGETYWTPCGGDVEGLERSIIMLDEPFLNIKNAFAFSGIGDAGEMFGFRQFVNAEVGKKYIASMYYRFMGTPIPGKNKARLMFADVMQEIEHVDNEWHRVVVETYANNDILEFCASLVGLQQAVYFETIAFQVEQSPVVTDWGLSKADVQNALEQTQTDVGLLQAATTPENIINTVVLSEEYQSAFAQVPKYEDISDMATGTQLTAEIDRVEQYVQQVQDDTDTKLSTLTSQLEQSAEDIRAQFKMSTGINLIRNSTGFFDLDDWDAAGDVDTIANNEIEQKAIGAAFYSDHAFTLTQTVEVTPATPYSFSFWQKKTTAGFSKIKLFNGDLEIARIGYDDSVTSGFEAPFIYHFITDANQSALTIKIENTEETDVYYSGLMLNEGAIALQWSAHSQEIANTNIRFNLNGIYVKNEVTNTYTIMSPNEFSGYAEIMDENGDITVDRIFTLNGDTTEVHKLNATNGAEIGVAHFVPINNAERVGLALFM